MPRPLSYAALATLSANGSTSSFTSDALDNEITVYLGSSATWGSGTLVLQASFNGGTTWINVPNASWTSGSASTQLAKVSAYGSLFRFTLSGATSPSLAVAYKVEEVRRANQEAFTLAANGSTTPFTIQSGTIVNWGSNKDTPDNVVPWAAFGTWSSGTLALQASPDGGTTWYNVGTTLTANGILHTTPVTDTLFRFTLPGASSPSLTIFAIN